MAKSRRRPSWQPRDEDYQRIFDEQNPWHLKNVVPEVWAKKVERPTAKFLPKRLSHDNPRRFQLILGPRRVGKTTAMYQTVRQLLNSDVLPERLWWLRLDHPLLMQIPLNELVKYVIQHVKWKTGQPATSESPIYLFLDELSYAESWDLWLKTFYDETWPVRIAGTSSATAVLREGSMESGAGRWEEQYLAPYLFSEYLELLGKKIEIPVKDTLTETIRACVREGVNLSGLAEDRHRFLLVGGFPELLTLETRKDGSDEALLLQSQRTLRYDAIERAIYKDIPQAFAVENPALLERLLYSLAGQFTGIMSPNNICEGLGNMSQPTFSRYLTYLERAFVVFALPNFSGSESSVQKRGRKLFFIDGAVRNAALQRGIAPLNDSAEMGLLVENMAAGHLHALSQQSQVRLYYWKDKNDEIDFVYDHPESPLAFELALSAKHHRRGMRAFVERYPRFENRCFTVSTTAAIAQLPEDDWHDGVGTLPLELFLLAVGAQMEKEMGKRLIGL